MIKLSQVCKHGNSVVMTHAHDSTKKTDIALISLNMDYSM